MTAAWTPEGRGRRAEEEYEGGCKWLPWWEYLVVVVVVAVVVCRRGGSWKVGI